uniref:Uncharacterized protein n=1 Tax=Ditylenchus dipsaci TaxID=166011 RepID=A0A915CYQ9_9BILA
MFEIIHLHVCTSNAIEPTTQKRERRTRLARLAFQLESSGTIIKALNVGRNGCSYEKNFKDVQQTTGVDQPKGILADSEDN